VVTRRDLKLPYQAVQSAHAAIQFQHEHQELSKLWYTQSNYLAFLTVANEEELEKLIRKAEAKGITHSIFREPDIGNEITAVAFEASNDAKRITSSCRMMGKEYNNNN
jgi:peptidyl-tRNA hydrolase